MTTHVYPYVKEGVTWGFGRDEHWPPGYAAKVLEPQHDQFIDLADGPAEAYLKVGQVVSVVSDEGDRLFISFPDPDTLKIIVVSIDKDQVVPILNYLDKVPAEIEARLPDNQRLVSDLVDDGYQLDRAVTEEDGYIWSTFLGIDIQRPFGLWYRHEPDGKEIENTFYYTSAWPTAVSIATELETNGLQGAKRTRRRQEGIGSTANNSPTVQQKA